MGAEPPTLPEGIRFCIDGDCPNCGWPERWMDPHLQAFGCNKCDYRNRRRGKTFWLDTDYAEHEQPRKLCKRPKVGDILGGATGPEVILRVGRWGETVWTMDRNGRHWGPLIRTPAGHWTVYPTLTNEVP